jgi:hypothetical protein
MKTAKLAVDAGGVPMTLKLVSKMTGQGYVKLFIRFKKLTDKLGRKPNYKELVTAPTLGRPTK